MFYVPRLLEIIGKVVHIMMSLLLMLVFSYLMIQFTIQVLLWTPPICVYFVAYVEVDYYSSVIRNCQVYFLGRGNSLQAG